jgi:hypothetical protein
MKLFSYSTMLTIMIIIIVIALLYVYFSNKRQIIENHDTNNIELNNIESNNHLYYSANGESINNNSSKMQIDIVFTYVDSTDKEWLKKKSKEKRIFLKEDKIKETPYNNSHDSSLEEIKYSVRSIIQYFKNNYRNIYFVTNNGKLPTFLKPHENLIPILDSELLGTTSYNSNTIETCLHKIPGLSEYYLYFNDDMMLTSKLQLSDLIKDGKPIWYEETSKFINLFNNWPILSKLYDFGDSGCNLARQKTYDIIGLKHVPTPISHSPRIFKKSMVIDFCKIFKKEIDEQFERKFRSENDFCFVDAFCHYNKKHNQLIYSNKYKTNVLCQFDHNVLSRIYNWLDNSKFLCIEDMRQGHHIDEYCLYLLKNKYPKKCKYEK